MKYTKLVLFIFNLIAICFHTNQLIAQDKCGFYVIDKENRLVLNNAVVISKIGKCSTTQDAFFQIDCSYADSVYLECSGYESIWITYNNLTDTVFMEKNSFSLEEVEISANSKRKIFTFGKKNKKVDSGYGFRYKPGLKLISIYPNLIEKKSKLIEGYIFLSKKLDSIPNIKVSLYKISDGKLGGVICENIKVENNHKNRGWYKLDFSQNGRIILPKEGVIVMVEQLNYSENLTTVWLLEYDSSKAIETFLIQPTGLWEKFSILGEPDKHYGIKLYLKVQ